MRFQSLFQWILYYDNTGTSASNSSELFQSLFQWILYYDYESTGPARLRSCSFNPCFSGSYIMTLQQHIVACQVFLFQSLFQWILYYDLQQHIVACQVFLFQSLFQWILYYDFLYVRVSKFFIGVSILVLVDLIL